MAEINTSSTDILNLCSNQQLIPVVVIDDVSKAVPLAQLLVENEFPVIEVTLRSSCALQAIEAMAKVPGVVVAAGTVTNEQTTLDACEAGAKFLVSPGFSEEVHEASVRSKVPLLPGAVTASEIMKATAYGYQLLKFFPADLHGGAKGVSTYSSVFNGLKFCPTGGVNIDNVRDYLRLPCVPMVGGSWMVSPQLISQNSWKEVSNRLTETKVLLEKE